MDLGSESRRVALQRRLNRLRPVCVCVCGVCFVREGVGCRGHRGTGEGAVGHGKVLPLAVVVAVVAAASAVTPSVIRVIRVTKVVRVIRVISVTRAIRVIVITPDSRTRLRSTRNTASGSESSCSYSAASSKGSP